MRAVTHDRDAEILSEAGSRSATLSAPCGPRGETVSIIGKSVSWARKYLGEVFDIPTEAMALIDGTKVSEDYVLEPGQVLEFTDKEGDDDWAAELYKSPEFWETVRERRREEGIPWNEALRRLDID